MAGPGAPPTTKVSNAVTMIGGEACAMRNVAPGATLTREKVRDCDTDTVP